MIERPSMNTAPLLPTPHAHTSAEFIERAHNAGIPKRRADEIYKAFHRAGERALFPDAYLSEPHTISQSTGDDLETIKFLLTLRDHKTRPNRGPLAILGDAGVALESESVLIPMVSRKGVTRTLCVSSQIGCAMGCDFCETAQMGLIRSLSPEEIVAQWFAAKHHLGHDVRNIVFMGMGEPLDNIESVLHAIEILTDHNGPAIAMRHITISTVGRIDGLIKLRERCEQTGWRQLNLAVSINAPNDEIRSSIMPINRAMPLGDLIPMLEQWPIKPSAKICAEYVLIPGVNDLMEHADELADLLKDVPCCVNVIPYNPRRNSPWPAPQEEDVERFLRRLESRKQFCKRRKTKGRDTMAACGQLGNEQIRKRRLATAP